MTFRTNDLSVCRYYHHVDNQGNDSKYSNEEEQANNQTDNTVNMKEI